MTFSVLGWQVVVHPLVSFVSPGRSAEHRERLRLLDEKMAALRRQVGAYYVGRPGREVNP